MDDNRIALYLMMNEPAFDMGGKQYSVCCPDETFSTWDSDGNELDFKNIHDLLDNWIVAGQPFRNVVENIM